MENLYKIDSQTHQRHLLRTFQDLLPLKVNRIWDKILIYKSNLRRNPIGKTSRYLVYMKRTNGVWFTDAMLKVGYEE